MHFQCAQSPWISMVNMLHGWSYFWPHCTMYTFKSQNPSGYLISMFLCVSHKCFSLAPLTINYIWCLLQIQRANWISIGLMVMCFMSIVKNWCPWTIQQGMSHSLTVVQIWLHSGFEDLLGFSEQSPKPTCGTTELRGEVMYSDTDRFHGVPL